MQSNKYAVFILTHGRPDDVTTYNTLRRSGYTGKIYLVIDDEDKSKHRYFENYPDEIIVFSKAKYKNTFDIMDNFENDKTVVYARNACYDIARKLKLDYFFEFEDDYLAFKYRYVRSDDLKSKSIKRLDKLFNLMITCIQSTNIHTLALVQGGDMFGGIKDYYKKKYQRKAMNTFLFKVKEKEHDVYFSGRMNDDVNTYLNEGKKGKIFMHITDAMMTQKQTQGSSGGNTEIYKQYGTYVKSFYSVMIEPSCCKIAMMRSKHSRIHHRIKWENAVPKIIRETHKK